MVAASLAGCDSSRRGDESRTTRASASRPLLLEVGPIGDQALPEIAGRTNLPDGTELMITLDGPSYHGQAKVTVYGGRFASERFSASRRRLPPGGYTIGNYQDGFRSL
ncbi:MAG: hypothetical protein ACXW27_08915 [Allosphingosinicella sp.]